MPELPSGTVTFAFTDIEDSTALLKRLGDEYGAVLTAHRRIVRDAFSDGIEMDTQGDAFFFVFRRARDSVAAAVRAQRAHAVETWPGDAAVRVRIGLHTGEPAMHDEGYVGLDVVRAARICTAGRGGQILLSEATRALLGSTLPAGVSVFPLGQRQLRGIDEPERVYEVAIEDLEPRESVPPALAPRPGPTAERPAVEPPAEDIGARIAASVQERVLRALEGTLGGADKGVGVPPGEGSVDDIAARMESLGQEIDARIKAALEKKGVS